MNTLVGAILLGCGVLFTLLSIPLLKGKIGMNRIYGVRFRQSFQSDEMWYRLNRYGARQLILWSVPLVVLGLVVFFIPLEEGSAAGTLLLLAPLVSALAGAFFTHRYARRLEQTA